MAATSEEIAAKALGLIRVDYDVLPAVFDVAEALEPENLPALRRVSRKHRDRPGVPYFGPKSLKEIKMGDVEKGFSRRPTSFEKEPSATRTYRILCPPNRRAPLPCGRNLTA